MTDGLPPLAIHTIGHSIHTADAFLALLQAHGIRQLADVRRMPQSTRHPHFSRPALATFLVTSGIRYCHFPALGGRRAPRPDSMNTALHAAFRGYADHMQSASFQSALAGLHAFALDAATAVMCAEAAWRECHRQLLADALVVRGVKVWHIASAEAPKPHEMSDFAREREGAVIYPGLL